MAVHWGTVGWGGCMARQGWKRGGGVVTYTWDLVRLRRVFLLHSIGFWEGETRADGRGGWGIRPCLEDLLVSRQ